MTIRAARGPIAPPKPQYDLQDETEFRRSVDHALGLLETTLAGDQDIQTFIGGVTIEDRGAAQSSGMLYIKSDDNTPWLVKLENVGDAQYWQSYVTNIGDLMWRPNGDSTDVILFTETGGLTLADTLSVGGTRPINIRSSVGSVKIKGNDAGWACGFYFVGSSDTDRGGFGALGSSDTLTYWYIGTTYNGADGVQLIPSTALYPQGAGGLDLGTSGLPFKDLFLNGVVNIDGNAVVGPQGAAVADATDAASAITQLNALLARCRAHGLIAT